MRCHLLNHSEWNVIMFLVCIDLEYGVSVFYSILKHIIHAIVDKICNVCVNVYRDLGFRPTLVVLLVNTYLYCTPIPPISVLYILFNKKYNILIQYL